VCVFEDHPPVAGAPLGEERGRDLDTLETVHARGRGALFFSGAKKKKKNVGVIVAELHYKNL
jgi:hypothetical protein